MTSKNGSATADARCGVVTDGQNRGRATADQLHRVVESLGTGQQIQVLEFETMPDFFLNLFDLADLADFASVDAASGRGAWMDVTIVLTAAPWGPVTSGAAPGWWSACW